MSSVTVTRSAPAVAARNVKPSVKSAARAADEATLNELQARRQAVDRLQAVAEFGLDGVLLTANENFLSVMGYSLNEVVGQHHSMFAEAAYRASNEYRMFWEKLGRGEYDAGQYKRIGKGGKEIWIQASYNPIYDMNGKPFKVVKYATDITATVERRMRNERLSADIERDLSGKGFLTALRAGGDARRLISAEAWRESFRRLDAEIAAAEQALEPIAGSPSPYFLLRLTAFLREAAARLAPKA